MEQFLAVSMGMADTMMVSSVGEAAISGVSLVDSVNTLILQVLAALDNEETGSQSRQGAGCLLVRDVLERIAGALGHDLMQMLAGSMLLSADNAHARHPNRPELSDSGTNAPHMNAGVVIKHNAAQHYTTDAVSAALFSELCRSAGVPVQHFSNRSDLAGGSTLGGILNRSVPLCSVDVGMAQLAMH